MKIEYPKMVYHKDYEPKAEMAVGIFSEQHKTKIVQSEEEHKELGSDWKEAHLHPKLSIKEVVEEKKSPKK